MATGEIDDTPGPGTNVAANGLFYMAKIRDKVMILLDIDEVPSYQKLRGCESAI